MPGAASSLPTFSLLTRGLTGPRRKAEPAGVLVWRTWFSFARSYFHFAGPPCKERLSVELMASGVSRRSRYLNLEDLMGTASVVVSFPNARPPFVTTVKTIRCLSSLGAASELQTLKGSRRTPSVGEGTLALYFRS